MVIVDDAAIEKRNNGKPTSEHHRTGFGEKQNDFVKRVGARGWGTGPKKCRKRGKGQQEGRNFASAFAKFRWSLDEPRQNAGAQKEKHALRLGDNREQRRGQI